MLQMFDAEPDVLKDIQFALIKGLSSLLQEVDKIEKQVEECIVLSTVNEDVLLQKLEHTDNLEVAEAIADLRLFSDGIVDWLLSDVRSLLISDGKWPICHVLLICEKTAVAAGASFHERASKLAKLLIGRVHSPNFKRLEHETLFQALTKLVDAQGLRKFAFHSALHTVMQTGKVDQRIRVLRVLNKAKIPFELHSFDNMGLEQRNEPMLLEVLAELNLVSDSLVEWFLSKPPLVTEVGWPMRNVVCICNILHASRSHQRATQLAENVLIYLHSTSFQPAEQEESVKALVTLEALLTHLPVSQFLETEDADQRMQVFAAAAEAGSVFGKISLGRLVYCLLHENIPKISEHISQKTALCLHFKKGHYVLGGACHLAHGRKGSRLVRVQWFCPGSFRF